jgi:excisionase family DNA binding protein
MAKPKKEVLLNHREAAKRLGVHPGTVHRYVSNGSLPHVRTPSNKIRIKQSDLSRLDEFYGGKFE